MPRNKKNKKVKIGLNDLTNQLSNTTLDDKGRSHGQNKTEAKVVGYNERKNEQRPKPILPNVKNTTSNSTWVKPTSGNSNSNNVVNITSKPAWGNQIKGKVDVNNNFLNNNQSNHSQKGKGNQNTRSSTTDRNTNGRDVKGNIYKTNNTTNATSYGDSFKTGYKQNSNTNQSKPDGYSNQSKNTYNQGGQNSYKPKTDYNSSRNQTGGYKKPESDYNSNRQSGGYNNKPQTGSYNGNRQSGGYNSKPQTGGFNKKPPPRGKPKKEDPVDPVKRDFDYFNNKIPGCKYTNLPSRKIYGYGTDSWLKEDPESGISLKTNFFEMQGYKNLRFKQFEINITTKAFNRKTRKQQDEEPNKAIKRKIILKYLKLMINNSNHNGIVTDFDMQVFINAPTSKIQEILKNESQIDKNFNKQIDFENKKYSIKLKSTNGNYITHNQKRTNDPFVNHQFAEILNRAMHQQFYENQEEFGLTITKNKIFESFDTAPQIKLEKGLIASIGYRTKALEIDKNNMKHTMACNIDTCALLFYEPMPVIDFLAMKLPREVKNFMKAEVPELSTNDSIVKYLFKEYGDKHDEYWQKDLTHYRNKIVGCLVGMQFSVQGDTTIYKVAKEPLMNSTKPWFMPSYKCKASKNRNDNSTVADKFKGKRFTAKFPVLQSNKINVPIELAKIEYQPVSGIISKSVTATLLNKISFNARDRKEQILNFFSFSERTASKSCVEKLRIKIEKDLISIDGVVLKSRDVLYKNKDDESEFFAVKRSKTERDQGEWKLNNNFNFIETNDKIIDFAVLIVNENNTQVMQNCLEFMKRLVEEMRKFGIKINQAPIKISQAKARQKGVTLVDKSQNFTKTLEKIYNDVKRLKIDIVFAMLGDDEYEHDEYVSISDCFEGTRTMCIRHDTIRKAKANGKGKNIIENLCQKVNFKLGGVNHKINLNISENAMVIGADVTHAETDKDSDSSIAAAVFSFDKNCCKYIGLDMKQDHKMEMIKRFGQALEKGLKVYKEKNGCYPSTIYYYRDGVSESQFQQVLSEEVTDMQRSIEHLRLDIKLNVIIVQKRHNTKFFCANEVDETGDTKNVPAGTVVDRGIVNPFDRMEFYLSSHFACKGTARSTKYVVIKNDSKISMKEYQDLTFSLTSIYQLCTKSVSLPAPTYYAHKLADRARSYKKGKMSYDFVMNKGCPTMKPFI